MDVINFAIYPISVRQGIGEGYKISLNVIGYDGKTS